VVTSAPSPLTIRSTISSPPIKKTKASGDDFDGNYDAAAVEGRIVQIAFRVAARRRRFPPSDVQAGASALARRCRRARPS
jgi:hypothetical protein